MLSPNQAIAQSIKRERERSGLSLSMLASMAGLSKSTLSQIEAGKGNPNIETLWAISTTLGIPFSSFFRETDVKTDLIRVNDGVALSSNTPNFSAVILSKSPALQRRDLYRVRLEKGAIHMSDPHLAGTIEHAFVCHGIMRVGPEERCEEIGPGDYFQYPADVPHKYEAVSDWALILLVIESRN